MKTDIDTKVEKLTNIKDKGEYTKLYNPLQKDWQAYQSAKNIVNRIKACRLGESQQLKFLVLC